MSLRRVLIAVSLAGLCACAPPPPRVAAPPPEPPLLDPNQACLAELKAARVAFEPALDYETGGSCGVANPVRVSAGSAAGWNKPGVTSCQMARSWARFDLEVVQPLAQRHFGQKVARLHHMGTYDCRTQRTATASAKGGGSKGGRLSEHSKGQAIDVGGFELADGTVISVRKDWRGAGKKSEFLQAVARASCDTFNVVLTPNHDKLHQDHLHLDIGPHKLCGY